MNAWQFGKLGALKVDGAVYAQPLFVSAVEIPGKGKRDVLFVAAEHDSVYAFDADRPNDAPLWHVSFLDGKRNVTSVHARDVQCPFIQPEVGITSTPVIDLRTGTLYVLARTMTEPAIGSSEYFQHLHALAITTGVEKFGSPRLISASVPGKGAGAASGQVQFNPLRDNPRAALLLVDNAVYLTWASSCDVDPYHGWVMAYDPGTLAQKAVLNVTPDGSEGDLGERYRPGCRSEWQRLRADRERNLQECPIGPVRPAKLHENRSTSDKSEQVTLTPLISARLNFRHRVFRPCGHPGQLWQGTVPRFLRRFAGPGDEAGDGASDAGTQDRGHYVDNVEEGGTFRHRTTEDASRLSIE